jgi:hypothetical protein
MSSNSASRVCKHSHDHVVEALGAILGMSGMPLTMKQAQILRHLDPAKCSDMLYVFYAIYVWWVYFPACTVTVTVTVTEYLFSAKVCTLRFGS